MKKYTAPALLLAAALALSACGTEDKAQPENSSGTTSSTTSENTSEESSVENTEEETKEEVGEPDDDGFKQPSLEEAIAGFPSDSFTAPDGTEIMLTEATSNMWESLIFDFAYIRYAQPIYSDTVTDPDLYDFENFEFTVDEYAEVEAAPFKVVKGQVLDNGLTVKEVRCGVAPYGIRANNVELEGELTLEGLLFCFFEGEYAYDQNELVFYTDPTSGAVPVIYELDPRTKSGVDLYSEFAFVFDGDIVRLGSINEAGSPDWFADSAYVRAKVTLENLKLNYNDTIGARCFATLKNVEFLD